MRTDRPQKWEKSWLDGFSSSAQTLCRISSQRLIWLVLLCHSEDSGYILWIAHPLNANAQHSSHKYTLKYTEFSSSLCRECQGIIACCNPVPPLVRQQVNELHLLIQQAREMPLLKVGEACTTQETDHWHPSARPWSSVVTCMLKFAFWTLNFVVEQKDVL